MVHLEVFELNFCGLNENLRRKIIQKGENEFIELLKERKNRLKEEEESNSLGEVSSNESMRIMVNYEIFD